jgi:hypothetical protein
MRLPVTLAGLAVGFGDIVKSCVREAGASLFNNS